MEEKKSCLLEIQTKYAVLTAVERTVADYILRNSESVVRMSVAKLAANAGTVSSAVIRCCKSLGFTGYSELKLSLAAELARNRQLNYVPYISPEDDTGAILDKVFAAGVKVLHDTAEKINRQALQTIVDLIGKARAVYIYGIATSAGIARDFQYRVMQLGYTVFVFTDIVEMKVSTMNIRPGDAAIGISHSGRTVATIEALRLAKEAGAVTACITSYPQSRITRICDHSIEIYADEIRYPAEAISARMAHIGVIDAIIIALSMNAREAAAERSKRTHEFANSIRYEERRKA